VSARRESKRYDREYFDRWYRQRSFGSQADLDRRVHYAIASAEYLLQRPIRSVLDVGCGEGRWRAAVHRVRPRASYVGVDPSPYAIERYGARRNLVLGGLGDLPHLGLDGPVDLIVCVDVLAYATSHDVVAGLGAMAQWLAGVAVIEVFTAGDDFDGDLVDYRRRPAATYRRWFADAGLFHVGPNLFVGSTLEADLSTFERGWT
jgi:SAM-dependent methyltransferase